LPAATQKVWVNGKAVKVNQGKIRLNKKENIVRFSSK
jgi:hypothetical protein